MARLRMRDTRGLESASGSATAHAALTTTAHGGIVADDDARLSDARTPTAHAASHTTGADRLQVSATDKILGRSSAGAGNVEEITCTSAARSILDDATIAAIRATLGLDTGNSPTFNGLTLTGQLAGATVNAEWCYEFCAAHLDLCSDPRLILAFLAAVVSGGTASDLSGQSNNATYVAGSSWSDTHRTTKAFGFDLAFNGSSRYLTMADADSLSFGNGTNDTPLTVIAVLKVTNSVTARNILYKGKSTTATEREWGLFFNTTPRLAFIVVDGSANKTCTRTLDGALTNNTYYHIALTYSGVGGSSAADGMKFYVNGVLAASTATNQAGYVAMENTAELGAIGAFNDGSGRFYDSSINFLMMDASEWPASAVWKSYVRSRGHFGL